MSANRALIDEDGERVPSVRRQCELIGLNRSSWYSPEPNTVESPENLEFMQRIDKIYTAHPFYGSRKITAVLVRAGHLVNRKRVYRLMTLMGLQSIAPKPNTSKTCAEPVEVSTRSTRFIPTCCAV